MFDVCAILLHHTFKALFDSFVNKHLHE